MVVLYMCVSIIGGLLTALLLGIYNPTIGLLSAPLGGSLLVALTALLIALPSSSREPTAVPPGVVWC